MARVYYKELVSKFHPTVFILIETHVPFERMRFIWSKLSYQNVRIVEARGHSDGIRVLCSNSMMTMRMVDVADQCISFEISLGNVSSFCSAVYANPHVHRRMGLWNDLIKICNIIQGSWILLENFNEILLQNEIKGGAFSNVRVELSAVTLANCRLFDMGAIGRSFTWYRKVRRGLQVAKKLDRAVINQEWHLLFSETYNEVLARLHSDHYPLLIKFIRQKRNKIYGLLLDDRTWATETQVLEEETNSFFQKLFSTRENIDLNGMGDFSYPSFSNEACQRFVKSVALEDVRSHIG
ncbi:uncharacterized protein [Arachis hypogaea]|uniref:uncharacterized protein n=1 Tax=Arachis hypogaea TaxID=3818 RepID=UPI003B21AD76